MSRVLVTGGVGTVGSAVVRRLLADPAYDVRVADRDDAPQWMREGCEIRTADLSDAEQAISAMDGCPYVIHLASPAAEDGDFSLIAASAALDGALMSAAVRHQVKRFVYVSCASAFEETEESARSFVNLVGERLCQAARDEYGLSFVVCRTASSPPMPTEEIAAEIVAAMSSPAN